MTPGTGRIETGVMAKSQQCLSGVEKKEKGMLPVEGKRTVFEGETTAVSGMRVMIVHKNQTTMPPHFLSHPCHEVVVCRRKEVSEAKVTMVPFFDNRAYII